MYSESDGPAKSPIKLAEIQRIEKTQLSSSEKHYLRVLAHCLACFKLIANASQTRSLPNRPTCLKWLMNESGYKEDEAFIHILLNQFEVAGNQLENLATFYQISPVELTLEHLINSFEIEGIKP